MTSTTTLASRSSRNERGALSPVRWRFRGNRAFGSNTETSGGRSPICNSLFEKEPSEALPCSPITSMPLQIRSPDKFSPCMPVFQ